MTDSVSVFMWFFYILTLFEQKYKFMCYFLEFIVDSAKECVFCNMLLVSA